MKLISPKEAAEMLGVTIYTLRNWNVMGKLVAIKTMGGHRRYKLQDIQRLLNEKN
jgi:putative resolvase